MCGPSKWLNFFDLIWDMEMGKKEVCPPAELFEGPSATMWVAFGNQLGPDFTAKTVVGKPP